MICNLHIDKQKTHICLKSSCGLQLLCSDCIQQSHVQHISLEIDELQRVIQNMIYHYDKQETLETINLTQLQANQQQLSQLFLQIQQSKNKTFNSKLFSVANDLLKKLSTENPSKDEIKQLRKVGNQFLFYRDPKDEWKFQLVNENKKLEFVEVLVNEIKQFSTKIQGEIDLLTTTISDLNSLIYEQEDTFKEFAIAKKIDKEKCRRGRPPKILNQNSPYRKKVLTNEYYNDPLMSIDSPISNIQMNDESKYCQNQYENQTQEKMVSRQPSPIIKQNLLDLYYDLEDASIKSDSPAVTQELVNEKSIESRRQPMRVQIIKENMKPDKRKYAKKTYQRFKFNTDLCLNIHEKIFG